MKCEWTLSRKFALRPFLKKTQVRSWQIKFELNESDDWRAKEKKQFIICALLYLLKAPRKVLSGTLAFQLKCFKNASNDENIAGVSV